MKKFKQLRKLVDKTKTVYNEAKAPVYADVSSISRENLSKLLDNIVYQKV